MDLKEFIENALVDIAGGIENAQKHEEYGGNVAPSQIAGHDFPEGQGVSTKARITSTVIQFDVAVTVENSVSGKGTGKGAIWVAEAKGELSAERSSSSITRIKFSVPLVFKPNEKSWSK